MLRLYSTIIIVQIWFFLAYFLLSAKKRHDNRAISGGYNGTNMYQAIE